MINHIQASLAIAQLIQTHKDLANLKQKHGLKLTEQEERLYSTIDGEFTVVDVKRVDHE